jgi:hypothetical protein
LPALQQLYEFLHFSTDLIALNIAITPLPILCQSLPPPAFAADADYKTIGHLEGLLTKSLRLRHRF